MQGNKMDYQTGSDVPSLVLPPTSGLQFPPAIAKATVVLEVLKLRVSTIPSLFNEGDALNLLSVLLANCKKSADLLFAYQDFWCAVRPHEPWVWPASFVRLGQDMDIMIKYCVGGKLPIFPVLLVPKRSRRLRQNAIKNIYERCRELGNPVGLDAKNFTDQQTMRSRAYIRNHL
jgi:hypothetical protein